jgi:alpha-1,3-mannosyltransferase
MRVVHVVRQFWPSVGGLEDVVGQLARAQMARGWTVKVVTLNRIFAIPDKQLAAYEDHAGLAIERLPYSGSSRYPLTPRVLGAIGEADLVHIHAIDFFFDFLAWTRLFHGKPLIATTHGGFFHTHAHARLKRIWFEQMTRRSMRAYDAVVACSEADYALFEPLSDGNLHRIDNGVDINKFAGCSSATPVKKLVTIGRFSVNKRLDLLLDVLSHLTEFDKGWQLDIIGSPSDWPLERLMAEIAARRLQAHVHVAIGATDAEAAHRLKGASFLVSASEHEGFGLVAVEALSAGLTPILQSNAAFRSLQARSNLIKLVDFAEPAATAAAIGELFAALPEDYAGRRQRAFDVARSFAWPRVADLYLDLYRQITENRDSVRRKDALSY